jgi:hypothetical protein
VGRLRPLYRGAVALVLIAGLGIGLGLGLSGGSAPPRTSTTGAPPPSAPIQLGANTGLLFNTRLFGPLQIAAQLRALRQTGATLARSDAPWEATEPAPPSAGVHRYSWAVNDLIAGSLAAHGLRWLPIIDYSPPWVRSVPSQDHSGPASPADYAAYAAALAARYGPGGAFWRAHPELSALPVDIYEIWNEPDNSAFWKPAPDPAAYADLYSRARAAIAQVQPGAHVIIGGLTRPAEFLPALLSSSPGLRGHIDGVGIHPYGATPQAVLDRVRTARSVLTALSLGALPLYITEFGWTTSPPGALDYLPQRLRPGYITAVLSGLGHSGCGLAAATLYAWVSPERHRADPQDWFGISPPAGAGSPDTAAFVRGVALASAPGPPAASC